MKKLLYLTDSHFRQSNPIGRKDNYLQSLIDKHMEVAKLIKKHKVGLVVHGGDLWDSTRQTILVLNHVIDIIKSSGAVWEVVLGNHEWTGNWDAQDAKRSALTALEKLGLIRVNKSYTLDAGGFKIHSEHTTIVKNSVPWDHTLMKDYEGPGDVILLSHYHPAQGTVCVGEKTFVSPGAISRGSRIEEDLTRHPSVALLTWDDSGIESLKIEYIKLKSAKPADEVFFAKDTKVEIDHRRADINAAIDTLKEHAQEFKLMSVLDVLEMVSSDFTKEVVNTCRKRLSRLENSTKN